ncbi:MAG: energy transducer TonB [Acidobacteriota bacterium]
MNKLRPLALAAALLWLPAEAPAYASEGGVSEFKKALEGARKQLSRKNYGRAADAFERANVAAGGGCTECLQGLGIAARRGRDRERALFAYEELLALGLGDPFDSLQRIITLSEKTREPLRGAAACRFFLESAAALPGQAAWALNELGVLLASAGPEGYGEALEAFRRAGEVLTGAEEDAGDQALDSGSLARLNLAEVTWRLGERERARALFEEALEPAPSAEPALRNLEITAQDDPEIATLVEVFRGRFSAGSLARSGRAEPPRAWALIERLESAQEVIAHLEALPPLPTLEQRAAVCAASVAAEALHPRLLQMRWPGPFPLTEEIFPPREKSVAAADYTDDAWEAGLEGDVEVMAVIDERGLVAYAETLRSLPLGLTEAALEAIRATTYEPAVFEGRNLSVCSLLTVGFRID